MNAFALQIGQIADDGETFVTSAMSGPTIDAECFRTAMRRIASSVAIVTFVREGRHHGFTATAHCSVSMVPPSLLVCVNRDSSSHNPLVTSGRFALNILADHQRGVAKGFSSGTPEDRFSHGTWQNHTPDTPPYLDDAAVSFGCRLARRVEFGSHTILIGVVENIIERQQLGPLVYLDRQFGRAEPVA